MATLTEATLDPVERRALDRLVELLEAEHGSDLLGVWLYGSRARGERTGPESDIDVMVITSDGERDGDRSARVLQRAAEEIEGNPWTFSLHYYNPSSLAEDRAIESFFLREVERDRIVLFGDEGAPILDGGGEIDRLAPLDGKMKPRSERFMDLARRRLGAAGVLAATDYSDSAVEPAYYASFNAARAGLSEHDLYAKTHSGVWHLFHRTFVATGLFDPELYAAAHRAQKPREDSAYNAVVVDHARVAEIIATAEGFVAAVEAMFE